MSMHLSFLCGMIVALAFTARADNAAPAGPPTAASLVEKATGDQADGKLDAALSEIAGALALDPKNTTAIELRGSIYMEQKLWNLAERDYTTLNQLSPDAAYQFKLAQIKFLQREYDDARPLYAALKDDPRLGDLANYKVFICDLFGAHESIAERDLATLDPTGAKPSYYYERAIWAAFHHDQATANRMDAQATGKFGAEACALYRAVYGEARRFTPSVATFTTRDGQRFKQAAVFLEEDGLRVSTQNGWVTVPLGQLPDDLSPFPDDVRHLIDLRRHAAAETSEDEAPVSFTTRLGKSYRQVHWTLQDAGMAILTPDGWVSVPFSELPDDLSPFPADAQKQIADRRREAAAVAALTTTVSFTTRQGKTFEEVRALLVDDGVEVTTDNGVVTVLFADLPADLSAFPVEWRAKIEAGLKSGAGTSATVAVVSFTPQKGAAYHEVRAVLGSDGVLVATPHGWVAVPFAELPADLSAFPAGWRPIIQAWLKSAASDTSGEQVVSFTTKRGKSYDRVRATLDDSGVDVLGPDGWVAVSFDQLPGDLSAFPAAWREVIAAGQKGH